MTSLTLAASPAFALQGQMSPSKESFTQFWTRFRAALAKDDRQAVAAMIKFRTGDSTYMTDKEFLAKRYSELRSERRCLARSKSALRECITSFRRRSLYSSGSIKRLTKHPWFNT